MPLLGGLLGALGGGGGLRSMLGNRGGGGGGGFSRAPAVDRSQPQEAEPQEQPQQVAPQKRQPEPEKQPDQPLAAEQVGTKIAEPVVQQQAEQQSPIKGLLDDAPASKEADSSGTADTPVAPSVVNNSEEMTPVTRPADEIAGSTPTLFKTDGVLNQLMDSGGNRQPMDFQEGMPARTPSIEDRSFQFKGPSSVDGALPARRYRARV